MKKKILALTLAAFTFGIVAANAQTQSASDQASCKSKTECCKKEEKKEGKKDMKRGERAKLNPFNGIELTQEQKSQIAALREQQKADRKKAKDAQKETKAKEREAYDAKIATILTPEQLAVYQSNRQAMKEAREQKAKKIKAKMSRKHGGKFESVEEAQKTVVM